MMMENQHRNQSAPEIEQAEEVTPEEVAPADAPEREEKISTEKDAPEVETPRVPDADTEGIP